jgi:hypothetical protein
MDKQSKKEMSAAYVGRKKIGGVYVIRNLVTGKILLGSAPDVEGTKNRFSFSQATQSCVQPKLDDDWKLYGAKTFVLEILETLEKKETQTDREFADDIKTLKELWVEKLDPKMMY